MNKRDQRLHDVYRLNVITGEMEIIAKNPVNFPTFYILHGMKDSVAPVEMSTRMCEALDTNITKIDLENFRKVAIDQDKADIRLEDQSLGIDSQPSYTFGTSCKKTDFLGKCVLKSQDNKISQTKRRFFC